MTDSQTECFVLLKPTAPLHLGEEGDLGDSADRIHSDTLWAALYTVAIDLGKQQFIDTMMSRRLSHFILFSGVGRNSLVAKALRAHGNSRRAFRPKKMAQGGLCVGQTV